MKFVYRLETESEKSVELTLEQVKACKSQELYEFFEHHDLSIQGYCRTRNTLFVMVVRVGDCQDCWN